MIDELRIFSTLFFVSVVSLLAIVLLAKEGRLWRLGAFIMVPIVTLATVDIYQGIQGVKGYPANVRPTQENVMVLGVAELDGKIYVWYYDPVKKKPRAIEIAQGKDGDKGVAKKLKEKLKAGQGAWMTFKQDGAMEFYEFKSDVMKPK